MGCFCKRNLLQHTSGKFYKNNNKYYRGAAHVYRSLSLSKSGKSSSTSVNISVTAQLGKTSHPFQQQGFMLRGDDQSRNHSSDFHKLNGATVISTLTAHEDEDDESEHVLSDPSSLAFSGQPKVTVSLKSQVCCYSLYYTDCTNCQVPRRSTQKNFHYRQHNL